MNNNIIHIYFLQMSRLKVQLEIIIKLLSKMVPEKI